MAVSRPFVLVVLGALLAVATFASMRSAADRAEAKDTAAAPAVTKPASPAKPATPPKTVPAKPKTLTAPAPPTQAKPEPKPKVMPKKKAAPAVKGVPPKVAKALAARRTVVLFFRQPGADDDATQSAVRSLRGKKNVSVFSDRIANLARYRRVIAGLGITQAPAVAIVGKSRRAVVIEGFVDQGTLTQQVIDAR